MDTRKTIGWNVRLLRVERGLSQERLALEADIDRSYIGRIERGSENVTVAALDAIAAALSVPVSRLFTEPSEGEPPRPLRSGRKRRSS